MRTRKWWAVLVGVSMLGACDLTVPDFNNADLNDLQNNPTRAGIAAASTGLLVAMRDEYDDRNGYVSLVGILGRESYNLDIADPRWVTELLQGALDPASPAFGANLWAERYRNIRQGDIIIRALDGLGAAEMSDPEKEAVRGFVKTIQAHELLLVANTRDSLGAVTELKVDPLDPPAPIEPKADVFLAVASLLDGAITHLDSAGSTAFPFPLSSGFTGFNTPETFVKFNRALKARVAVYMGTYGIGDPIQAFNEAISALDSSFYVLSPTFVNWPQQPDLGVYHVFTTGSGDNVNELFDPGEDPNIVAHPSIFDDAELLPGEVEPTDTTVDRRFQRKIRRVESNSRSGTLSTDMAFRLYGSLAAPMPIIRNEELILLRAEAHIGLGQFGAAEPLINFIRENSGELDPVTIDASNAVDQLLYETRYSLLFEGGHRWIDLRRYGRLDDPALLDIVPPATTTTHRMNRAFPVPEQECLARGVNPPCSVLNQ